MLNFPLKPSPLMIQDQASAAKQASEPNVQKTILNLLNTTATHVMRAVNSSLSALTIIDTTPLVEPSEAYGLCHDTVKDGVALNIGGNAADARLIPFWMCRFVNSDGKITSNLLTLMGDDAKQTAMFEQALCALGAEDLLTEINKAVTELKAQPMPDEVQGKIVLFPLGATAIKGDQYLSITPVPSAAMILKFKDRFFAEVNAQKAHSAEAKKNKQSGSHRVFNYPNSVNVNIVASNPATAVLPSRPFLALQKHSEPLSAASPLKKGWEMRATWYASFKVAAHQSWLSTSLRSTTLVGHSNTARLRKTGTDGLEMS